VPLQGGRDTPARHGPAQQGILEAFAAIFPRTAPSCSAPSKARRYDNEAPEKNPSVRPYWPVSAGIARRGTRLSKKMVRDIVRKVALV
jgi:hypothetical protein